MTPTAAPKAKWYQKLDIHERLFEATSKMPKLKAGKNARYGVNHDEVKDKVRPVLQECGLYWSANLMLGSITQYTILEKGKEVPIFVAEGNVFVTYHAIGRGRMEDGNTHTVSCYASGSDNREPMFAYGSLFSYGVKYCLCNSFGIITGETSQAYNNTDSHNFPPTQETQHRVDSKLDEAQESPEVLEEVMFLLRELCKEKKWVMNDVQKWIKKTCGKTLNQMDDDERKKVPPRVSLEYEA